MLHPLKEDIEFVECVDDPLRACFGIDEPEIRISLEDTTEHEMPQRPMTPPGDFEHEHGH